MQQKRKRDHFGCLLQRVLQGLCKAKEICLVGIILILSLMTFFFLAIRYQGHLLAKELVTRGLQTTLITDSAVFAMISRVNMVY
jgi:hypothetical protein